MTLARSGLNRRVEDLEVREENVQLSHTGASDRLLSELADIADRLRSVPLDDAITNAAPVEVAALMLDRRLNDEVWRLCRQYQASPGTTAKLFKGLEDWINGQN